MPAVTAYDRFFEKVNEVNGQTELWLKDDRINDLISEAKVRVEGKHIILDFGFGKDQVKIEMGGFKQDAGVVSYAKVMSAGRYTAPITGFASRGRAAAYRIL